MLPSTNPIPDWSYSGVLPPIDENEAPSSPYEVSLYDVVARFCETESRRHLVKGLLDFRARLHYASLIRGFQWIDGSFVENAEEARERPPEDIDVVTFFRIPDNHTEETLLRSFPELFNRRGVKDTHGVDSYFVPMNGDALESIVSWSVYWNSLWSHRKGDLLWKGYLQVDLSIGQDAEALAELERLGDIGGQQ